ncbi:LysR family transcriptional regulator [Labrys okinawensis]|uniref:LysR family transcriptional regulator n=1 Tax=Labrys okinawensis TaxID=346911 RepID=A0A2S9Q623_9HYPH|nr:LysR family transcriptional regulator [Labrys okinawensis]PRH84734.1 LysR family transcriptional regulator [Labrys okinawensis]
MILPDLNLLIALDVLLTEGSVAAAAKKMNLSPPAMSRTLGRIRDLLGDPVLVRSGRGLTPTVRVEALRERLRAVAEDAQAIIRTERRLDLARLERTFTIHANDGFVETFGAALIARVMEVAPGVRLRFAQKPEGDDMALRAGRADLETGATSRPLPELRVQALFKDRFVGAVRVGHPLLEGRMTPKRFAAFGHISASRRGLDHGPIDDELAAKGLRRRVAAVVPGFSAALALARDSDLVASVPEKETSRDRYGLAMFPLPVSTATITVSQFWHPRLDADPAHRWLRSCVKDICR